MNQNILSELNKTRNALRKKFFDLKQMKTQNIMGLEETFKPLTGPLNELVNNNKKLDRNIEKEYENDIDFDVKTPHMKKRKLTFYTAASKSTKPKYEEFKPVDWRLKRDEDSDIEDDDQQFYSQSAIHDSSSFAPPDHHSQKSTPVLANQKGTQPTSVSSIQPSPHTSTLTEPQPAVLEESLKNFNVSQLARDHILDKSYGPYKNESGQLMLGNNQISVTNNAIEFDDGQNWRLTNGLYSLIFHNTPKNYNSDDLEIYREILIKTNVYRRNFQPNGQVKGTRALKYSQIIKPLLSKLPIAESTPKSRSEFVSGSGFMALEKNKPNYVYWDDPNELVERLHLLIASETAGNTNHTNEITSIIEELKEAKIIY